MIPQSTFYCPHCGAPGMVNMGAAEYSCLCRFNASMTPQCRHIAVYNNGSKRYECQVCGVHLPTSAQIAPMFMPSKSTASSDADV